MTDDRMSSTTRVPNSFEGNAMDTSNPNFGQGMAFGTIGFALLLLIDFKIIGLVFLALGAQRLYTVYAASINESD